MLVNTKLKPIYDLKFPSQTEEGPLSHISIRENINFVI